MKTTQKMLLSLATLTALSTVGHATCATHVDMGNHRIVNVSDPVNAKDVVNKRSLVAYMYETMKNRYIRDTSKEVVLDVSTNLMWQDDAAVADVANKKQWVTSANFNAGNYSNTSGDTATTYCSDLSLGGYTDWRLPTINELSSIVKSTVSNPSISSVFQHIASDIYIFYWSSTSLDGDVFAEFESFSGNFLGLLKNDYIYVRCVREGQ